MGDQEQTCPSCEAPKAPPMTLTKLLGYFLLLFLSAGVLGFCLAVAYGTFVKTCHAMGVG